MVQKVSGFSYFRMNIKLRKKGKVRTWSLRRENFESMSHFKRNKINWDSTRFYDEFWANIKTLETRFLPNLEFQGPTDGSCHFETNSSKLVRNPVIHSLDWTVHRIWSILYGPSCLYKIHICIKHTIQCVNNFKCRMNTIHWIEIYKNLEFKDHWNDSCHFVIPFYFWFFCYCGFVHHFHLATIENPVFPFCSFRPGRENHKDLKRFSKSFFNLPANINVYFSVRRRENENDSKARADTRRKCGFSLLTE